MEVRRLAADALLLECAGQAEVAAVYAEALRRCESGDLDCLDVVPAATTVLLDGLRDRDAVLGGLGGWSTSGSAPVSGEVVELPTTYDGPDLERVAELWGVPVDEVAERHRSVEFTVAFCGFSPGFAYLTGLPEELHVPRRDEPRDRVPSGSVGLAGPWTGVYPRASPGGWQLLGRTDATLWDLGRDPPALLAPGTRVRFVDG